MRTFSARETAWLQELDGIELANFWPRAFAFVLDWMLISLVFTLLASVLAGAYIGVQHLRGKPSIFTSTEPGKGPDYNLTLGPTFAKIPDGKEDKSFLQEALNVVTDIVIPVLYFGIFLWKGKGQTPGKRIMKIRVVSLVHHHISFWHAAERALGYGAAALELGFGFVQFFIHPYRRCAQDRLAETIVVTERSYQLMKHKFQAGLIAHAPSASNPA